MKINGSSSPPLPLESAQSGKGRGAVDKNAKANVAGVDATVSTGEARLSDNGVDVAKVEAIKDAIREGRFQVNAEAVADKLIESVRELVGRK